jgi:hypothetical protein
VLTVPVEGLSNGTPLLGSALIAPSRVLRKKTDGSAYLE